MKAEKESPVRRAERIRLQDECGAIGRSLLEFMEPGCGFALLMFDFGDEGSLAYVSNAQRETMIRALIELVAKLRVGA